MICYVQTHCVLAGFGFRDSQQSLAEHLKVDGFHNRRLRHHCSYLYTYLLTSYSLGQGYLQHIHIMVILLIPYMIALTV